MQQRQTCKTQISIQIKQKKIISKKKKGIETNKTTSSHDLFLIRYTNDTVSSLVR